MIDALILPDHHEYIDPNVWFGSRWKNGEPPLLVVHNERGVFMWMRYSTFFNSHATRQYGGRDDWMEICKTCGCLTEVGSNFQCKDHFWKETSAKLKKMLSEQGIQL